MNSLLEGATVSAASLLRLVPDPPATGLREFAVMALAGGLSLALVLLRPRQILRHLARLLTHTLYRVDADALATVPRQGPALLIANHVSFVDAVLIAGLSPRPVRFVMDARIHDHRLLRPLFRATGTIPILPARVSRSVLARAHDSIAAALANGELVCIFPEGGITRDGRLAPFRRGVEHIVRRTPVPVIPIALGGLWGSIFSRAGRRFRLKGFRRRLPIISARPVPPGSVRAGLLQREVAALLGVAERRTG